MSHKAPYALEVSDLRLAIDHKQILKGIDLRVEPGQYLTIIGPNGAGKSTLLKCLNRIIPKFSGQIKVQGRDLAAYSQRRLAQVISYVPQAGGQIPPLLVRDFVALGRYCRLASFGSLESCDRRVVEQALERTRLTHLADRSLLNLSGGERQKAYVAAALAQEAGILLLDEPTSFLDPKHAAELNQLMESLNQEQGLTILSVTHDLNHALKHQMLIIKDGEAVFNGRTDELLSRGILDEVYQHEFIYVSHPLTGRPAVLSESS